jgi:hypothetical protein
MTESQKQMKKMQDYEAMVKAGKSIDLHILNTAQKSPVTKAADRLRSTYKRACKEISLTGLSKTAKGNARGEIMQAAKQELAAVYQAERENIADEIDKLKTIRQAQDYRNRADIDRSAARYNRRIQAMSNTEINEEISAVRTGKKELSEDQFDCLSAAAKALDPHQHEALRESAKDLHVYEPWLNTDEGKELQKLDTALKNAADGNHIPVQTDDGYQLIGTDAVLQAEE